MGKIFTRLTIYLVVGISCAHISWSQEKRYPDSYFRSPLDLPLVLAGNFGELRSGHFHSGLDLKTNGEEGHAVLAVADGWVSRIKVSPVGYGNAVYINHPNGFTSVYAHLRSFAGPIAEFTQDQQYKRKRFAVDLYPEPNQISFKKGDLIALSGNSGGSFGPHLHFEIRDSKTSRPLNPLFFGFEINDSVPPKIFGVKLYPLGPRSSIVINRNGAQPEILHDGQSVFLDVEGDDGTYSLSGIEHISIRGTAGFGLSTHDYHDDSNNRLGIYRLTLSNESGMMFRSEMEKFSFSQTRYINSHIDYRERTESRKWVHKSYVEPGNKLPLYRANDAGLLRSTPGAWDNLSFTVEDSYGNTSTLDFSVYGATDDPFRNVSDSPGEFVSHSRPFTLNRDGISLAFPEFSFYSDFDLNYSVSDMPSYGFSRVHHVHERGTPIHKRAKLTLKVDSLGNVDTEKLYIVSADDDSNFSSLGGKFTNGWMVSRMRTFGSFFVAADTTNPRAELRIPNGGNLKQGDHIDAIVSDNETGLSSYECTIDGSWRLCEYDPRKKRLRHTIDERTTKGTHTFRVRVKDGRDNSKTVTGTFTVN